MTAYNLVLFIATFGVQAGLGVAMDWLIGRGVSPQDAFRVGVAGIAALQAGAWLLFVFWPGRRLRSGASAS